MSSIHRLLRTSRRFALTWGMHQAKRNAPEPSHLAAVAAVFPVRLPTIFAGQVSAALPP